MDVSDIFYFFLLAGRGKGGSEVPGGEGDRFFIENRRGGGGSPGPEEPRGQEGVCGLSDPNRSDFESQIASDCNRNSKKSLRLQEHL